MQSDGVEGERKKMSLHWSIRGVQSKYDVRIVTVRCTLDEIQCPLLDRIYHQRICVQAELPKRNPL